MNKLFWIRIPVAVGFGTLFLVPMALGWIWVCILCVAVSIGLLIECYRFCTMKISIWQVIILAFSLTLWQVAVFIDGRWIFSVMLAIILMIMLSEVGRNQIDRTWERVGLMTFLFFYAGVMVSTMALVRGYGCGWGVFPAACIWTSDTFAYWGGSAVGKHKLAFHLSPKKTIEGFFFGLLGAALCAFIAMNLNSDLDTTKLWILAGGIGLVGQLGDLFESKLKRELGIKDTGKVFPGHGGIWDRTDSLLWSYALALLILKA